MGVDGQLGWDDPAAAAVVPLSFASGDESEGLRPLERSEWSADAGNLGGNAESFVPY